MMLARSAALISGATEIEKGNFKNKNFSFRQLRTIDFELEIWFDTRLL